MVTYQGDAPDLVDLDGLPTGARKRYAPADSSNYSDLSGTTRRRQLAIVIHTTEEDAGDSVISAANTIQNPDSNVSYHYVVANNGDIIQLVRDSNAAWHVSSDFRRQIGKAEPTWWRNSYGIFTNSNGERGRVYNNVTFGIALEGRWMELHNTMAIGGSQWQSLAALLAFLCDKYSISYLGDWLHSHEDLNIGKNDPGPQFPWSELRSELHRQLEFGYPDEYDPNYRPPSIQYGAGCPDLDDFTI